MNNIKIINILGYVKCKESKDSDFIVGNYYPILSYNNGVNIIGESQEIIYVFHNYGDEMIMVNANGRCVDDKDREVVMGE